MVPKQIHKKGKVIAFHLNRANQDLGKEEPEVEVSSKDALDVGDVNTSTKCSEVRNALID